MSRNCFIRWLPSILAWAALTGHAAAPDPALLGCWRATHIALYTQDGTKAEDRSGRCVLRFKETQFESTCQTSQGATTTTYHYHIPRPQVYAATMASSGVRTEMVGSLREYEYRIAGEQLRTVTAKPLGAPALPSNAPRVETEAERTPCP